MAATTVTWRSVIADAISFELRGSAGTSTLGARGEVGSSPSALFQSRSMQKFGTKVEGDGMRGNIARAARAEHQPAQSIVDLCSLGQLDGKISIRIIPGLARSLGDRSSSTNIVVCSGSAPTVCWSEAPSRLIWPQPQTRSALHRLYPSTSFRGFGVRE